MKHPIDCILCIGIIFTFRWKLSWCMYVMFFLKDESQFFSWASILLSLSFKALETAAPSLWQKGNFFANNYFPAHDKSFKKRVFRSVLVGFTNRLNVKIYLTFWHHYTIVCVWSLLPKGAIFFCPKCYTYKQNAMHSHNFRWKNYFTR